MPIKVEKMKDLQLTTKLDFLTAKSLSKVYEAYADNCELMDIIEVDSNGDTSTVTMMIALSENYLLIITSESGRNAKYWLSDELKEIEYHFNTFREVKKFMFVHAGVLLN